MSFVPTRSLPKLLCKQCGKYLSHFPIYWHPTAGQICGRCPVPADNAVRNETYEDLARYQKFPCCHSSNGCLENVFPENIPKHERLCLFRLFACPMLSLPGCEWQGFSSDLLDHFEQKHPTFLLNEGRFEIDFIHSHKENYLLPYGEDLYIVNRTTDSKTSMFSCTVEYAGTKPCAEDYYYKLILESGNKSKTHEISKKVNTTVDINGDIIRSILNDPISIIARIEIFQEQEDKKDESEEVYNSAINYELLRELECLVCMEYMVPPIHQCITGHSICLKCKGSVTECPTCKQEFKNTQNFALAQIINHIIYPCKHDRCKFSAKPKEIKQHEVTCIYGPLQCPLKEYLFCDTEVIFSEMYDHILEEHYENLLEMETVTVPFEEDPEESYEDCYIIKFGSKLFKHHYLFNGDKFLWAVQLIGQSEESGNYKFEIDVIDNSGNNGRAYFKTSCSGWSSKEDAFNNNKSYICMNYDQIKPLITTELSYRICILQN